MVKQSKIVKQTLKLTVFLTLLLLTFAGNLEDGPCDATNPSSWCNWDDGGTKKCVDTASWTGLMKNTAGYCKCSTQTQCIDDPPTDFDCITTTSVKISSNDGGKCSTDCLNGSSCWAASNYICTLDMSGLQRGIGGECKCSSQTDCYTTPYSCSAPSGGSSYSVHDYRTCNANCGSDCHIKNENVCYDPQTDISVEGTTYNCICASRRKCITTTDDPDWEANCDDPTDANTISQWDIYSMCGSSCGSDSCYSEYNFICAPRGASGKGYTGDQCKRSQVIVAVEYVMNGVGINGEYMNYYIYNRFDYIDVSSLAAIASAAANAHHGAGNSNKYYFALLRTEFDIGDTGSVSNTYQSYYIYGDLIHGDAYQRDKIKNNMYMYNWDVTESLSSDFHLVFWNPRFKNACVNSTQFIEISARYFRSAYTADAWAATIASNNKNSLVLYRGGTALSQPTPGAPDTSFQIDSTTIFPREVLYGFLSPTTCGGA